MQKSRIPAFVNGKAGTAAAVLDVLRSDPRVALHETEPDELRDAVSRAVKDEPPVIIIAGGDGTLSSAAPALVGTSSALSVVPAGTLNHFAQRIGVPLNPREALEVAFSGRTTPVDVGRVNDQVFLNTCVMGVYVSYVRRRDLLKPRFGYAASSVAAAVRTLYAMGSGRTDLHIENGPASSTSSLIFVGVGERDFRLPLLGELTESGRDGLHLVVVKPLSRARLLAMVMRTAARGVRPWPSEKHVESFVVDDFRLTLSTPVAHAVLDGEIVELSGHLTFRRDPSALLVRTV